jgi:two-component system, response regulator FlrC
VDVRIIAATNRDLAEEVRKGRFREDLYFRLKQIRIEIPPLRERVSDIVPLALHFVEKHAKKNGRKFRRIEPVWSWTSSGRIAGPETSAR